MTAPKKMHLRFSLNGQPRSLEIPAGLTALELLRDRLDLKGAKEGCGVGECGACTIRVDGKAVNACLMLAAQLDGREVRTVEGLDRPDGLHPLQEAFLNHHGVQCGFCTPGLLMSADALLEENADPSREEIVAAIAGNLCRCTGYQQILSSIEGAAGRNAGGGD
ncbi:MAG: (2Fe-2S)-binding protein [Desulfobacterales bacterium]|nr:(2Fe-2S)-binding protein [Desulfobacterales bacterium]